MKNFFYIVFLLMFACNSEDANDCFQTSGDIIRQDVEVGSFERILVNRDVELILSVSDDFKVTVETGQNLINDVKVEVVGNRLELTDKNNCNFVRDYGITKIYVEAPNVTEIRNSSQYTVSSIGVITYPNLRLISEDFNENVEFTVGDYDLNVNSESLEIVSNNISSFYINGETENLNIGFYAGSGRFEGQNLIAQNVNIYHRGSNDMVVNPIQSLSGTINGTGNVIAVNQPESVNIEEVYIGQLLFD